MAIRNCVLLFLALLAIARCEQFIIVVSHNEPCPGDTCLTLPEVSLNTSLIAADDNTTTLWLQPGNHSIGERLLISDRTLFRMLSNDTSSTTILCQPNAGIEIRSVDTVEICGLRFIGCSFHAITQARNLTVFKSTFEGTGGSDTALVLNEATEAHINGCSFISNRPNINGVFTNFDNFGLSYEVNFDSSLVNESFGATFGGAIRSTTSSMVIENSRFEGNGAHYGGAIFAELNSNMTIKNTTFYHNWAITAPNASGIVAGGGAVYVNNSQIDVSDCMFVSNHLVALSGYSSNGGALLALNSEISMSQVEFTNNTLIEGEGKGGAIYASDSTLKMVSQSRFIGNAAQNAGVMSLRRSNATIFGCNFERNEGYKRTGVASIEEDSSTEFKNSSFSENKASSLGGVLYVSASHVSVNNCTIVNNFASQVGAVMSILKQAHVSVSSSIVSRNKATLSVISVYDSSLNFSETNLFTNNHGSLLALASTIRFQGATSFHNCTTADREINNAFLQEGGAVSAYSSHLIFQGTTMFVQNSAIYGGALFIVESSVDFVSDGDDTDNTTLQLPWTMIDNNTAKIGGGGMYLYHSSLTVRDGQCYILGNTAIEDGGGIHTVNSDITVEPRESVPKNYSLLLWNNHAQLGGGMNLEEASQISVSVSTIPSIKFVNNTASYGAAMYVDDDTKFDTCFTTPVNVTAASECFFRVIDPNYDIQGISVSASVESITFEGNSASVMGSNLFGGLLDRCIPNTLSTGIVNTLVTGVLVEKSFDAVDFFQNVSNIKDLNTVSSEPVKVCLCVDGQPRCFQRSHEVQVQKGQLFYVSVAAVNQVEFPVHAKVFSRLSSPNSTLARGQREVNDGVCTDITFSVLSPHTTESLSIFADGPCRSVEPSQLTVSVTFLPCNCPIGFENMGNNTSCECTCDSLISRFVDNCDPETQTFVRRSGSWIGYSLQDNQSSYTYCARCPFRYCRRPPDSIPINFNNATGPGSDAQCASGHRGTICGICSPGYSVSLAHKRCLPCPDNWYFIFIAVVVGTILAGLGLVIGILATNFTVAVGTINGFIFYANIVDVYDSTFLPLSTSSFPVLIIEWLNLDPGIDICFVKNIDLYWHTWVRLIFPAYIIIIIVVIIAISHCSVRFSQLIAKKNPVATLATLLFLSFTNVLETTVVAMRTIKLTHFTPNGPWEETVWLPDGEIRYFRGKHIPLFLVAVVLVFLTFAYVLLLVSWQWTGKFSWLLKWRKSERFKNFMEAYNGPYSPKHRYWTGLMLFVRVLLILISIATEGSGPTTRLVSTMFVLGFLFLLRMTYAKDLYRQWYIELLETVNLFNLFAYVLFIWFTLDDVGAQQVIAYISTSIAFVMILCVIACHIYLYLIKGSFPKVEKRVKRWIDSVRNKARNMKRLNCFSRKRTNVNNLEASDDGNGGGEDRFHEMLGTLPRSAQTNIQEVHNEPEEVPSLTFTVLETPYIRAEQKRHTEYGQPPMSQSYDEMSVTL